MSFKIIYKCIISYRWYVKKDDDTLSPIQNDRKFRTFSSGLKIGQISIHDSRVYICIANNTVGSEKSETTLVVVGKLNTKNVNNDSTEIIC